MVDEACTRCVMALCSCLESGQVYHLRNRIWDFLGFLGTSHDKSNIVALAHSKNLLSYIHCHSPHAPHAGQVVRDGPDRQPVLPQLAVVLGPGSAVDSGWPIILSEPCQVLYSLRARRAS